MNIFDFTNDIFFSKKGDKLDNIADQGEYSPYMINRWCSMYSPSVAIIINETVNMYWRVFETKQQHYKYLVNVIPKHRRKRISYISKPKEKKAGTVDKEVLKAIASNYELSIREVKEMIQSPFFDKKLLKPYKSS